MNDSGGLPLDVFTRQTPPGWRPGLPKYPLRRYTQLMKLWWRQTDMPEPSVGPAMTGRLRGAAFQLAFSLRANRLDTTTGTRREMVGDELLSQPSHDDWSDALGVLHPAEPAGGALLMGALQAEFGLHQQDMIVVSLDALFAHSRDGQSLSEYVTYWRLCLDEAAEHSGLRMINVGKIYLLLKAVGLGDNMKQDFLMQIGGDLDRFEELAGMMNRFSKKETRAHASSLPAMAGQYWTGHDFLWEQDYYDDYNGWYDDQQYDQETYHENSSYDEYGYDEDYTAGYDDTDCCEASEDYWNKGKGKGKSNTSKGKKGDGCTMCGSKYHSATDCPLARGGGEPDDGRDNSWSNDKGGGKSKKGFGKSKGKHKTKGKFGKNKGGNSKGKGKFKRPYYEETASWSEVADEQHNWHFDSSRCAAQGHNDDDACGAEEPPRHEAVSPAVIQALTFDMAAHDDEDE